MLITSQTVSADARATAVGVLNFFGAIMSAFATLFKTVFPFTLIVTATLLAVPPLKTSEMLAGWLTEHMNRTTK
jgi:hypothetical protein